jgi:hypothetical protein
MRAAFSIVGLLVVLGIVMVLAQRALLAPRTGKPVAQGAASSASAAPGTAASAADWVKQTGLRIDEALQAGEQRQERELQGSPP